MKKNGTREMVYLSDVESPIFFISSLLCITKMTKNHKQRVQFEPIHKKHVSHDGKLSFFKIRYILLSLQKFTKNNPVSFAESFA